MRGGKVGLEDSWPKDWVCGCEEGGCGSRGSDSLLPTLMYVLCCAQYDQVVSTLSGYLIISCTNASYLWKPSSSIRQQLLCGGVRKLTLMGMM
ncbi:hypothetical protein OPV22_027942 [Ensete ventricosum]|uniref:Uncharacterized protein n=1 Tax=Ensete ventricosum TaxID=4639 RepID=A0AAV8PTB3_ENSVE|nr:hypothetical protein OPV22_027942 [Ensete ventricosum]